MKPNRTIKFLADAGMTVLLLLLMAYELVGQAAHEWLGIGMFVLLVLHHVLNRRWSTNILKGTYTPLRVLQTLLVIAILFTMLGSMVSGVILSRHVFSFLPISGGRSFARNLHMLCAYWGFVLMSLHLGLHWGMMVGIAKKHFGEPSKARTFVLRALAMIIAGYGIFAFVRRGIGGYLLMKTRFVFFDFEEPLIFFFLDYVAAMGLFVFVGHYVCTWLRRSQGKKRD